MVKSKGTLLNYSNFGNFKTTWLVFLIYSQLSYIVGIIFKQDGSEST